MDAWSIVLLIVLVMAIVIIVVLYQTVKALKVVDDWMKDSETEMQMHVRDT